MISSRCKSYVTSSMILLLVVVNIAIMSLSSAALEIYWSNKTNIPIQGLEILDSIQNAFILLKYELPSNIFRQS